MRGSPNSRPAGDFQNLDAASRMAGVGKHGCRLRKAPARRRAESATF